MSPQQGEAPSAARVLQFLRALSTERRLDRAARACGISLEQVEALLAEACELVASHVTEGSIPGTESLVGDVACNGQRPASDPVEAVQIFTDGASRGNPGPAAAGVLIKDVRGREIGTIKKRLGVTTNNVAEYQALLLGLEEARRLRARQVTLFSDSELMVKQMKGLYKVRSEDLIPLHAEATARVRVFERFVIIHVKRGKNAGADALANEALDDISLL